MAFFFDESVIETKPILIETLFFLLTFQVQPVRKRNSNVGMASAFQSPIVATKIMIVPMGPMKQTVHQTQVYIRFFYKCGKS